MKFKFIFYFLTILTAFSSCKKNDSYNDLDSFEELLDKGKNEFIQGNYNKSFEYFSDFVFNTENTKKSNLGKNILESYLYIGMIHERLGNKKDALLNYNKTLLLAEESGNKKYLIHALVNMADLEENPESVREVLNKSISESNDSLSIEIIQKKYLLAKINALEGKTSLAEKSFKKMINLDKFKDDPDILSQFHEGLGITYKASKQYNIAIKEFDMALNLLPKKRSEFERNELVLEKTETLILNKNYDAAKICLDSLKLYAETSGDLPMKKRINECYLDVYEATNEPINGFTVINDLREIDNELYEQSVGVKGHVLNKIEHNAILQEIGFQKARFNYLIIFMLLSSLIFYLYHKFYKKKKEVEILEQERKVKDEVGKRKALENKLELESINAFMNGQEEERKRFASQLHDGLGANLSAINMHLSTIKKDVPENKYEKVAGMLKNAINETRSIAHSIMPPVLQNQGLIAAITEKAFEWNCSTLEINVESTEEYVKLNDKLEITLYRGIQECINNIIKHANASIVHINFKVTQENSLIIKIVDNGIGFDTSSVIKDSGIGLNGLKARVKHFGGSFDIQSEPEKGATVEIKVPVAKQMKQVG